MERIRTRMETSDEHRSLRRRTEMARRCSTLGRSIARHILVRPQHGEADESGEDPAEPDDYEQRSARSSSGHTGAERHACRFSKDTAGHTTTGLSYDVVENKGVASQDRARNRRAMCCLETCVSQSRVVSDRAWP